MTKDSNCYTLPAESSRKETLPAPDVALMQNITHMGLSRPPSGTQGIKEGKIFTTLKTNRVSLKGKRDGREMAVSHKQVPKTVSLRLKFMEGF